MLPSKEFTEMKKEGKKQSESNIKSIEDKLKENKLKCRKQFIFFSFDFLCFAL